MLRSTCRRSDDLQSLRLCEEGLLSPVHSVEAKQICRLLTRHIVSLGFFHSELHEARCVAF